MSTPINDGGPAFPLPASTQPNGEHQWHEYGMSLRDYFAGQFLAGFVSTQYQGSQPCNMATQAYEHADAMIEARKGGQGV